MRAVLRLFVLIPLAYVAAALAAGLFFVLAAIGIGPDGAYLDAYRGETALLAAGVAATAGAVGAAPAAVAIVAAEIFGWRSLLFYLAVGLAIGLAAVFLGATPTAMPAMAELRLHAATGAVGGCVYWLIAGRGAGPAPGTGAAGGG